MGRISVIIGVVALVGLGVGFVPCLGWLNWTNNIIAFAGLICGGIGAAGAGKGDNELGQCIAGIVLNAVVLFFGIIRLVIGGGVV